MKNYTFTKWCLEAVSQIKYTADRDEVYDELRAHLEDHRDALMAQGYSREDAERLAVEAMGSAKELAPQLAAVHKPFWGYVYSVMVRVTTVLVVFTLLLVLGLVISYIDRAGLEEAAEYPFRDYFDQKTFETESYSGKQIALYSLNDSLKCDDYTISLKQAAIWEVTGPDGTRTELHIKIDFYNPWCRGYPPQFIGWFQAEDSLGNQYPPLYFSSLLSITTIENGKDTFTYDFKFVDFDTNTNWIDLRYDRGGRSIRFRIMLTGGDDA